MRRLPNILLSAGAVAAAGLFLSLSSCGNPVSSHLLAGKSIIVGASENDRFALHLITETNNVLSDTVFLKYWPGTNYWFADQAPVFYEYHPMPFEMVGHWPGFQLRKFAFSGVPYQTASLSSVPAKFVQVVSPNLAYVSDGFKVYRYNPDQGTVVELFQSNEALMGFHIFPDQTLVYQLAPAFREPGQDQPYGTTIFRTPIGSAANPLAIGDSEFFGYSDEKNLVIFKDQSGEIVFYDFTKDYYRVPGLNIHDSCLNLRFLDDTHLLVQQEKGGATKALRWVLKLTTVLPADLTEFEIYTYDLETKNRNYLASGESPVVGGVFYLIPGIKYTALP